MGEDGGRSARPRPALDRHAFGARSFKRAGAADGSKLMTISADQIRQARKLLGWHRGDVAIRAWGITGNTVGKAEGAFPGSPPTPEQLQEIRVVLEAAGIEFTLGTPGVRLRPTSSRAGGPHSGNAG
jgi:hypothetical protein